jgi:hypothetical protein
MRSLVLLVGFAILSPARAEEGTKPRMCQVEVAVFEQVTLGSGLARTVQLRLLARHKATFAGLAVESGAWNHEEFIIVLAPLWSDGKSVPVTIEVLEPEVPLTETALLIDWAMRYRDNRRLLRFGEPIRFPVTLRNGKQLWIEVRGQDVPQ